MKSFDENQKYGRVRGIPGVLYEQDGQLFNAQKHPVQFDEKTEQWVAANPATTKDTKTSEGQAAGGTEQPKAPANQPAKRKSASRAKPKSAAKPKAPANQPAVPEGVKPMRDQVKDEA